MLLLNLCLFDSRDLDLEGKIEAQVKNKQLTDCMDIETVCVQQVSVQPDLRGCLPEQAKLSQQIWVGAAPLWAGLARCVMLRTEMFDLCQDLSGK